MEFSFYPLGENAVLIEFGTEINMDTHRKIQVITTYLNDNPPEWMIEYIPAFTTITIFYDPIKILKISRGLQPYHYVCQLIERFFSKIIFGNSAHSRTIEIPVCYGGEFGPDLQFVADHNNLTTDEVITIHASREYIVYMIGFAPGFAYIGGMSEKIAAPRRKTPRLKIPERSVGIAGMQTGIYPIETPGGWQIIGRTPYRLFAPEKNPPTLLMAGDKIKFTPIRQKDYRVLENSVKC